MAKISAARWHVTCEVKTVVNKLRHSLAHAGPGVRFLSHSLCTDGAELSAPGAGAVAPSAGEVIAVRPLAATALNAHESGHWAGMEDRGYQPEPPEVGPPAPAPKPGDPDDPRALMYGVDDPGGGWEVNPWEAAFFYAFTGQIWNDFVP